MQNPRNWYKHSQNWYNHSQNSYKHSQNSYKHPFANLVQTLTNLVQTNRGLQPVNTTILKSPALHKAQTESSILPLAHTHGMPNHDFRSSTLQSLGIPGELHWMFFPFVAALENQPFANICKVTSRVDKKANGEHAYIVLLHCRIDRSKEESKWLIRDVMYDHIVSKSPLILYGHNYGRPYVKDAFFHIDAKDNVQINQCAWFNRYDMIDFVGHPMDAIDDWHKVRMYDPEDDTKADNLDSDAASGTKHPKPDWVFSYAYLPFQQARLHREWFRSVYVAPTPPHHQ